MTKDKIDIEKVFQLLDETTAEFAMLVSSFDDRQINAIPYDGSWTAAQVAEHVTLSNLGIAENLQQDGKACEREPDAGAERLRSIFLNFSKKLTSPEFILPTKDIYDREAVVADLKKSIGRLNELSKQKDLFRMITHPIFGEITKLELLYFIVYHTQRHIHQLRNIQKVLNN